MRRALAIATVILAALTMSSLPAVANEVAELEFAQLINGERAAIGLDPLDVYWDLTDDARLQSQAMKAAGYLFHNPALADVTTGWWALGENVGFGGAVAPLHAAFMASPGHRANILGDYNYLGVGVVEDGSALWATMVFMLGPDGLVPPPAGCRLAGADRYATAAEISNAEFPSGADTVYVATGLDFPDALAGGAAAAASGSPILLVSTHSIPAATAAELARLSPSKIVVLGGTSVVSTTVEAALSPYAPTVVRWSGADRFATAASISSQAFPTGSSTVYLSTGASFADALAAVPAAKRDAAAVLLVTENSIPAATMAELVRLAPSEVVIVGGTGVVSDSVAAAIPSGMTVRRLAGSDRYATAASISADAFPTGSTKVYISTGTTFPDALAGGAAAAHADGPILLVSPTTVPMATANELVRLAPSEVVILGGAGAVADSVAASLHSLVGP